MKLFLTALLTALAITGFAQYNSNLFKGASVITGSCTYCVYPNTEFIQILPTTGERPVKYKAEGLPAGVTIDPNTGIMRGVIAQPGVYKVNVAAYNSQGGTDAIITINVSDTLARTPVMGWNSWNVFTRDIDEKMLMEMADAMVNNGMQAAGYQYLNIDDFWHAESRDSLGRPVADPKKFPHGIKYVADYVHSKGLKLGIYSCAGNMTCGRCFGGYGHEEIDAQAYAEWGVDLLKYDYCYAPWGPKAAKQRYTAMGTALKKSGRSIIFSVCEWGFRKPWLWAQKAGGSYWRTTPDIVDTWNDPTLIFYSTMKIVNRNQRLAKYAGPGHWNDPDMLTIGNYGQGKATSAGGKFKGMTDIEYQSQMSLWCMFSAPLLSSCDLRHLNDTTLYILTNPAILAINQDVLGKQAELLLQRQGVRVYNKDLAEGGRAIALLNTHNSSQAFTLPVKALGNYKYAYLTNVWSNQPEFKNRQDGNITFTLKPHEVLVYFVSLANQ